jgi:glycosyltransferase
MSLMTKRNVWFAIIGGSLQYQKSKSGLVAFASYGLFKKSIIDSYGFYNLDFKIASDTDWLLRYLYQHRVKMIYLSSYIVKMQMGGWAPLLQNFEVLQDYKSTNSMV